MKNLAFLAYFVLLAIGLDANAQSIAIGNVSRTTLCAGDSMDVQYTATGSFTSRNSFTVQLSTPDGSFDNFFYNVGSLRTPNSGAIRIGIPSLPKSSQYRLRVISSEPFLTSAPWGATISIGPRPVAAGTADFKSRRSQFYAVMIGDTVRLRSNSSNADTYFWTFGPDAIPATSSERDPLVRFTSTGLKRITLEAQSEFGCSDFWASDDGSSHDNPYIVVVNCEAKIPAKARVDSTSDIERRHEPENVWVVPGGVSDLTYGSNYFVEPGGSLINNYYGYSVVYLKAGATYLAHGSDGVAILYENGAGISSREEEDQFFECSNLEFDYSDAPPYKIQPASVSRLKGSNVSVYPNPVASKLTIEHKEMVIREIIIRNTLGAEQLFVKPEGLGPTRVDVSHLAPGLYFVDIIGGSGIETHKIVVNR